MMESSSQKLRQKAINLLYLIFLAMIFTYVSSDFVDAIQKSDQTTSILGREVEMQTNRYNLIVLNHLKNDSVSYHRTKHKIAAIDAKTSSELDFIDSLKFTLIAKEGFNAFGYFKGGKREVISNEVMIEGAQAAHLFDRLKTFKLDISQFVEASKVDQIDSIMPLSSFEYKSDGQLIDAKKFYFSKHPLTVSVMNLTMFKSQLELVRSYIVNNTVEEAITESTYPLPAQLSRAITADHEGLGSRDYLPVFLDQINWDSFIVYEAIRDKNKRAQAELNKQKNLVTIESLSDSVYAVGKPIRFDFGFDTTSGRPVTIELLDPVGLEKTFVLNGPGTFLFVPETKGFYEMRYSNGITSGRKNIKVLDLKPILETGLMGTLYIGINNQLNLRTSEFEDTEGLQARISKGQILKKGKSFYARVTKEGQVRVEVFAQMSYGFVRIADKQYVVRKLNPPIATLQDQKQTTTISTGDLSTAKSLKVKSDELLVEEEYYISNFEMTIIYNGHTAILRPIPNVGNFLNSNSLEALSKASEGDIIMFNNIKAKSSLGTDIELRPLTYTITN
ncbi:MAG: hypothetical protein ACI9JN_002098 [Bacteroidia bacterium]|jgi:hypothetical protein